MKKFLQKLGKSFMLPVSILPVVSILFGIGFIFDYEGWGANSLTAALLINAGLAIIDKIPILFAVGIPVGLSKERDGAAALSGLTGYLVVTKLLDAKSVAMYKGIAVDQVDRSFGKVENVFIGIIVGVIAAYLYDRFSKTELPAAFSFFSGRRLVPILTVFASILFSLIMYLVWPPLYNGLVSFGESISKLGALGAGLYGFFNRLLIPTGLHHALNAVFWFDTVGINDLGNFWKGVGEVGTTGRYMAGYFPIMMFGLPGAALAMYHTAKSDRKKAVGSILLAGSIAAFVTGLTEPLEFLFMFLSPVLYLVHAILTGISMFIAATFKWTAGFNFSAGFIDWFFSSRTPMASQPVMLLLQGLAFFVLYYLLFRFFITKFNLETPGRESVEVSYEDLSGKDDTSSASNNVELTAYDKMARKIYDGLGGKENLVDFDYCATRVRAEVKDSSIIDKNKIMSAGITNIMVPGKNSVQVIVGPKVQFVVDSMKEIDKAERV